jgi:Amt family ammonium transporter
VFFSSFAIWYIIKNIMGLRVSLEDETQGIDISEFGQTAYSFDNFQQLSSEGVR